jgi:arsenate reductase
MPRPHNVLFLCTGNSARSILTESIMQKDGAGRFNAFSAGSHPKGAINPFAPKVLKAFGYPHEGFRSKSWDEFTEPGAPVMDPLQRRCQDCLRSAARANYRGCSPNPSPLEVYTDSCLGRM